MGKNHFTDEQQEELRENPYIQKISKTTITYTREFKEKFETEYRTGKQPSEILTGMGINHRILGKKRKDSIVARIKQYEMRPEGCTDNRVGNSGRPRTKMLTDVEKIKRLEQKVTYLQQENEFLKKNILMDREMQWEYKHHHQASTGLSKK